MPNRYICTVLDEMRDCTKTLNFSYLLGLIEEAQTLANRMEAKLSDNEDIRRYLDKRSQLKKEVQELQKEKKSLQEGLGKEVEEESYYI